MLIGATTTSAAAAGRARRASRRRRVRTGGASYRVEDDVRERILPEAARAPIEGERKVLMLFEAERLRGNKNESANAMLKTLEEPPDRTVVVLVTDARRSAADDPVALPAHRLRSDRRRRGSGRARGRRGTGTEAATLAALAGGQIARARSPGRSVRCAPRSRPRPRASTATARPRSPIAQELDAAVDEAASAVEQRHKRNSSSSTRRWNGSATRNATRSGCAAASTNGKSEPSHAHRPAARRRDRDRVRVPRPLAAPAPALNADRPACEHPAAPPRRARRVPRGARGVPHQREGHHASGRAPDDASVGGHR